MAFRWCRQVLDRTDRFHERLGWPNQLPDIPKSTLYRSAARFGQSRRTTPAMHPGPTLAPVRKLEFAVPAVHLDARRAAHSGSRTLSISVRAGASLPGPQSELRPWKWSPN